MDVQCYREVDKPRVVSVFDGGDGEGNRGYRTEFSLRGATATVVVEREPICCI